MLTSASKILHEDWRKSISAPLNPVMIRHRAARLQRDAMAPKADCVSANVAGQVTEAFGPSLPVWNTWTLPPLESLDVGGWCLSLIVKHDLSAYMLLRHSFQLST